MHQGLSNDLINVENARIGDVIYFIDRERISLKYWSLLPMYYNKNTPILAVRKRKLIKSNKKFLKNVNSFLL